MRIYVKRAAHRQALRRVLVFQGAGHLGWVPTNVRVDQNLCLRTLANFAPKQWFSHLDRGRISLKTSDYGDEFASQVLRKERTGYASSRFCTKVHDGSRLHAFDEGITKWVLLTSMFARLTAPSNPVLHAKLLPPVSAPRRESKGGPPVQSRNVVPPHSAAASFSRIRSSIACVNHTGA